MNYNPSQQELSEWRAAGGYLEWRRLKRYRAISPSIIRVIQLCYQSGITEPNTIKKEVLRILRLPKCHQREDDNTIDYLIPEVIADFTITKLLQIPLVDPFTKMPLE